MPDHKDVYDQYGVFYDQLVSQEDYQGNILRAIQRITSLSGKDIIELGAGTGRLTYLLVPYIRSIQAFDTSQHMLDIAFTKLKNSGMENWKLDVSDHRALPAQAQSADIAISGWSICYLVDWNRSEWKGEVEKALGEMQRVLRSGGVAILLETLGAGYNTPHPPDHLIEYYQMLEEIGFEYLWIRTDYRFNTVDEATELVRFFFDDVLADQVYSSGSTILPECTGIWWRKVGHEPTISSLTQEWMKKT